MFPIRSPPAGHRTVDHRRLLSVRPAQRHPAAADELAALRASRRARGQRRRARLGGGDHREAGEAREPVAHRGSARPGDPGHVEHGPAAACLGEHAEGSGDPGHGHVLGRGRPGRSHRTEHGPQLAGTPARGGVPSPACVPGPPAPPRSAVSRSRCPGRPPPPGTGSAALPSAVTESDAARRAGVPAEDRHAVSGARAAQPGENAGRERGVAGAQRVEQRHRHRAHRGQVVDVDQDRAPARPIGVPFGHRRDYRVARRNQVAAWHRDAVAPESWHPGHLCHQRAEQRAEGALGRLRQGGDPADRPSHQRMVASATVTARAVCQPSRANIGCALTCTVASNRSTPAFSA